MEDEQMDVQKWSEKMDEQMDTQMDVQKESEKMDMDKYKYESVDINHRFSHWDDDLCPYSWVERHWWPQYTTYSVTWHIMAIAGVTVNHDDGHLVHRVITGVEGVPDGTPLTVARHADGWEETWRYDPDGDGDESAQILWFHGIGPAKRTPPIHDETEQDKREATIPREGTWTVLDPVVQAAIRCAWQRVPGLVEEERLDRERRRQEWLRWSRDADEIEEAKRQVAKIEAAE